MYEVDLSLEDPHGVNLQVSVHEVELPLRVSKDEVAATGGGVSERRRFVTAKDLLNLASVDILTEIEEVETPPLEESRHL